MLWYWEGVSDAEGIVVSAGRVSDEEIETLLWRVYVEGGFTAPELAATVLRGPVVRARGELWSARDERSCVLVGMVMLVLPASAARRIAEPDEAEMHLLAVAPEQRGRGVGSRLVEAVLQGARDSGARRMVLWTQPSMHAAHRLYVAHGFVRAPARDAQLLAPPGRTFVVFEKEL
jgi:ribosomal protein S18 acetylase RimI-like enzyme